MRRLVLSSLFAALFALMPSGESKAEDLSPPSGSPMPENSLSTERSPYLRQHRTNPVDWYPWGPEALERAKKEDRPIFLSVGYAACHWCHVMEHESFEDEATAKLLNDAFVCVKVDREERPDIDALYMRAVQLMTGRGGWPMTVILTPAGDPFFAGTYLPRDHLQQLTRRVAELWHAQREDLVNQAATVSERVRDLSDGQDLPLFEGTDAELLRILDTAMAASFDAKLGGYGGAPKFPPHTELLYLLDRIEQGADAEDDETLGARAQLRRTLEAMAAGGVHDHVGGGFHRYSTDAFWFLPHFEKMLYDNALLAQAYARFFALTGEAPFADVAHRILAWAERELARPDGGYASSLDADTDGEEGLTYTWTIAEIEAALPPEDAAFVIRHYGPTAEGNFRDEASGHRSGRNILHLEQPVAEGDRERALALLDRLRAVRDQRPQPGLDDKVITAWNGLFLSALARCGTALEDERYLARGRALADVLLAKSRGEDGTLLRFPRASGTELPGFCDDHVHLAEGLLDLAEATGEMKYADAARDLGDRLLTHFEDSHQGGFFSSSEDLHEALLARQKETFDGPIPSENGTAPRFLLRLAKGTGEERYRRAADRALLTWRPLLGMARSARGTVGLYRALADRQRLASASVDGPAPNASAEMDLLRLQAWTERAVVRAGSEVRVLVRVTVAAGWHVNPAEVRDPDLVPTVLAGPAAEPATLARVTAPSPVERVLVEGMDPVPVLEGAFSVRAVIVIAADASPGPLDVPLTLSFQPCSGAECQAPATLDVTLPLVVAAEEGPRRHESLFR